MRRENISKKNAFRLTEVMKAQMKDNQDVLQELDQPRFGPKLSSSVQSAEPFFFFFYEKRTKNISRCQQVCGRALAKQHDFTVGPQHCVCRRLVCASHSPPLFPPLFLKMTSTKKQKHKQTKKKENSTNSRAPPHPPRVSRIFPHPSCPQVPSVSLGRPANGAQDAPAAFGQRSAAGAALIPSGPIPFSSFPS